MPHGNDKVITSIPRIAGLISGNRAVPLSFFGPPQAGLRAHWPPLGQDPAERAMGD